MQPGGYHRQPGETGEGDKMAKWKCDDGNAEVEIVAGTAKKAAQKYVDMGDWDDQYKTFWVNVQVAPVGGDDWETIKIAVDPNVPPCDGEEHNWQAPHRLVGGLRENPGVYSSGGGASSKEICVNCAKIRITDGWATDTQDGVQGLDSIEYQDGDLDELKGALRVGAISEEVNRDGDAIKVAEDDDGWGWWALLDEDEEPVSWHRSREDAVSAA